MTFFKQAVVWLAHPIETPPPSYGAHHLIYVALFVVGTFVICYFLKNCSDKTMRRVTLFVWIPFVLMEIGNQLVFTYDAGWQYPWEYFPFQLCSTPLYLMPLVAFTKEGKFRDAIMAFISTFAFFGGLVVFIYPNDVFCWFDYINHKTMLHHGTQILIGIFYFVYNRKKVNFAYFVRAIYVFVACCVVAIFINEIGYATIVKNDPEQMINMFYFSRHFGSHLPILSNIWQAVKDVAPVLFTPIYIVGFSVAALLMQYIMVGIYKLVQKLKAKKHA
jgi:hypothetical protein